MLCLQCQNELTECVCPDLKDRLEFLFTSPHLHFSEMTREKLMEQAEKNVQKTVTE